MKIGKTKVEVFTGPVSGADVEAIIIPANDMLWLGGGIASDIRKHGGDEIEREAMKNAPADIGSAVISTGGKLHAAHVIHAVIGGQDLRTDEKSIRKAVNSALTLADNKNAKSVGMPLLDSGAFDVEIHVAAGIMVDEAVDYLLRSRSPIERLLFIEHDSATGGVLDSALREKFTKHG